jgi:hypothetical protein
VLRESTPPCLRSFSSCRRESVFFSFTRSTRAFASFIASSHFCSTPIYDQLLDFRRYEPEIRTVHTGFSSPSYTTLAYQNKSVDSAADISTSLQLNPGPQPVALPELVNRSVEEVLQTTAKVLSARLQSVVGLLTRCGMQVSGHRPTRFSCSHPSPAILDL